MRVLSVLFAALTLAGCASPPGSAARNAVSPPKPLPAFVMNGDADPNTKTSSAHWDALYFASDGMSMASVMAKSQDNIIMVTCFKGDFAILVTPKRQLAGPLERRSLALAFDDGPLIEQDWGALQLTPQDWDFDVAYGRPGFQEAIDGFRQHREVTAVIRESGKEVLRQSFTLEGARKAIDFVMAACGKAPQS